jgi:hypothetical protein
MRKLKQNETKKPFLCQIHSICPIYPIDSVTFCYIFLVFVTFCYKKSEKNSPKTVTKCNKKSQNVTKCNTLRCKV